MQASPSRLFVAQRFNFCGAQQRAKQDYRCSETRNSRNNEGIPPYAAIQITVTLTIRFGKHQGDCRVSEKPKRILLTGGVGFIGSHVAEALLGNHFHLSIVDNLDEFYSPAWKRANLESIRKAGTFDFYEQDICDMERIREVLATVRPDAIIHLAARAGVRPSIEQPRL